MAGIGDDIDQGRLIILLRNRCGIHALGDQMTSVCRAQGQTHGKTHTLTGDGALQKDGFTVQGTVAGHDLIGQVVGGFDAVAGIGHAGNLGEHILANIRD